jgi:hypothetical protein
VLAAVVAAGVVAGVVAGVGTSLGRDPLADRGRAPDAATPPPRPPSTAAPPCPRPPPTTDLPAGARVLGGRWHDSCRVVVLWLPDEQRLLAPTADGYWWFALGRPGDVVLFGDWDCDGRDTPALYRPSSGTVHQFDRWADRDGPVVAEVEPTGVLDGRPTVVDHHGCATVQVTPP